MENEDWDVMPGVTYVKGFLRTYATYLGLDPEVIIGEFRSRGMAPSAEHHEPFGGSSVIGKPHSHRGRNTVVIVAVVCLIALAAIYALGMMNGGGGRRAHHRARRPRHRQPVAVGAARRPSRRPAARPSRRGRRTSSRSRRWTATAGWRSGATTAPGVVLFSGTLRQGDKKKFKGKDIWMSLGAPGNVRLEAAGKDVKLKSDVGPWTVEVIQGRVVQGP